MSTFERHNYSDQLNIETPEQVELQFHVAGLGSRFVAVLLDHIIQGVGLFVLIIVAIFVVAASMKAAGAFASMDKFDTAGTWMIAFMIFILFMLNWGYFALFEAYWKGQTPGKRVMKLRAIKDSGRQITLFEALARNLLRYVDYLPSMYLIGVITMLCNQKNKRLGDYAAGTLVVHERSDESPMFYQNAAFFSPSPMAPAFENASQQTVGMFPADAIARLQMSDLQIIDAFFGRALDLDMNVRATMALRIARTMTAKMGAPMPEGNPERVLEAIAVQMRGSGRRY
jgi:uncharacterized RDD family membrane protein YckC